MNYKKVLGSGWKNIWKSRTIWLFTAMICLGSIPAILKLNNAIWITIPVQFLLAFLGATGLIQAYYTIEQGNNPSFRATWMAIQPSLWKLFLVNIITLGIAFVITAPFSFMLLQILPDKMAVSPRSTLWATLTFFILTFIANVLSFVPSGNILIRKLNLGDSLRQSGKAFFSHFRSVVVIFTIVNILPSGFVTILIAVTAHLLNDGTLGNISLIALTNAYIISNQMGWGAIIAGIFSALIMPLYYSVWLLAYLEVANNGYPNTVH